MAEITYRDAINQAMAEEMARDETVYLIGEQVTNDLFGTERGLVEKFGKERVRDTAISEAAVVGSSVGAALAGYRPIINILSADFLFCAGDEVVNKAAKWRFGTGGKVKIPMVIRAPTGGYYSQGIEHSQSPEAFAMHLAGLKVAVPSTPYDAKGLLKTAIRDNNPVIFFEHKALMDTKGEVPRKEYMIPFGVAEIKKKGKDVTVIAISLMVKMALEVAGQLGKDKGIDVEVIDPRTLEPLDIGTIVNSVKKTRRVVIVDEDNSRCGVAAEIGMQIMENAFGYLDAPIRRVSTADMPIPSGYMEQYVLPQPRDIYGAIEAVLA